MDRGMLAHSACHEKRSLISSVPHAVLDDKMATAAAHTVVMRNPDTVPQILFTVAVQRGACHTTAMGEGSIVHLKPQRGTRFLELQNCFQASGNTCLNDQASVFFHLIISKSHICIYKTSHTLLAAFTESCCLDSSHLISHWGLNLAWKK